ncbi:MAG TPA: hypothetical protein VGS97_25260 [Actinocrinis sp.]|uniref:hypothetical protein n=1 Tax=Actinocrinis sp. TaxID=1920516 RepID=UPI002DDDA4D5|nr:hypothetical protein [Actinocrinis sp.]HEV2347429.1 hypothetical protein [Actinocrinis sp.]
MTDTGSSDPARFDAEPVNAEQNEAARVEEAQAEATAIETAQLEAARIEAAARRSRARRNALRWTGAAALALAIAGGITYAISVPQRTDIPGLSTASDGRYAFPTLALPTLPAGQPVPSASANQNAMQHLADIRQLLLPHPIGATMPSAGASGWFDNAYRLFNSSSTKVTFAQYGLRHTATTSWTTADGATTNIYLLQFADGPAAANASKDLSVTNGDHVSLSAALSAVPAGSVSKTVSPTTDASGDYSVVTTASKATRYGAFVSGDVIALVIQSGPASQPPASFLQTVTLQAELLQ